jgi:hypothetical protein
MWGIYAILLRSSEFEHKSRSPTFLSLSEQSAQFLAIENRRIAASFRGFRGIPSFSFFAASFGGEGGEELGVFWFRVFFKVGVFKGFSGRYSFLGIER